MDQNDDENESLPETGMEASRVAPSIITAIFWGIPFVFLKFFYDNFLVIFCIFFIIFFIYVILNSRL